ncbi:MAG: C39 family peptidase [Patescibacteria group bacterium]
MKRLFPVFPLLLLVVVGLGFAVPGMAASSTKLLTPTLSVDIPTITFSDGRIEDDVLKVNYLGDYIAGIYKYLLGISTTIAIVMIMVGGLQWSLGGQSPEAIGKAKTRIKNAVTGLVLLLGTYVILFTVNPQLIGLQFPELEVIQYVFLSTEDTGSDVDSLGLSDTPSTGTNNVPYYSQRNYTEAYGSKCEGSPTIKTSGCGPTSLAMVLSFYGVSADPKQVASSFENGGYRICGSGTAYNAFTSASIITSNNMVGEILPIGDHTSIVSHLENDEPIIISVGKSRFTSGGHFIVLTGINEDGTFSINDPNSGIQSAEQSEIWGIMKFAVYVHKKQ